VAAVLSGRTTVFLLHLIAIEMRTDDHREIIWFVRHREVQYAALLSLKKGGRLCENEVNERPSTIAVLHFRRFGNGFCVAGNVIWGVLGSRK
jgi:hypothetical protein